MFLVFVASVAANALLNVSGANSVLTAYTSWSESSLDCFGSSCPTETVYNLFLNATADSSSYCAWAASEVAKAGASQAWTNFAGQTGVSLNADAFLGVLFATNCTFSALSSAADNLVQLNGAPPSQPVSINVVELSPAAPVTDSTFSNFLCWVDPSQCPPPTTLVINVFVSNFCKSGCVTSSAVAPTCYGSSGCAANGHCVAHNKCVCDAGYAGARCATQAGCDTDGCFNRGTCNANGVCSCNAGYSGARCEISDNGYAPAPTPAASSAAPPPAAHGALVPVSDAWLAPASIFPTSFVSHWGQVSYSQLPLRDTADEIARRPIAQPIVASARAPLAGYVFALANYTTSKISLSVRLTYELHAALNIGNQASNSLRVVLFVGDVGLGRGATTSTNGNVTLTGSWRPSESWLQLDWPAWSFDGLGAFPIAFAAPLAAGDVYLLLIDATGAAVARAQLGRVDEAHGSQLTSAAGANYAGAVVAFVDTLNAIAQYWAYYTTPLSYVERGASIRLASTSQDDTIALALGSVAVHRVGAYNPSNFTIGLSYAVSKTGSFNLPPTTLAALVAGQLAFDAIGVDAALNASVEISGVVA